jgi:hypothetical protein
LDAVERAVKSVRAARPDLHFHIDAILGDADFVAVVGSVGNMPSVAAEVSRLIWLIRVKDGRLAEMWTYRENRA